MNIKERLKKRYNLKTTHFGLDNGVHFKVAIETGITPCTPHRSRRAVFPHRAPQLYSLP